MLRMHPEVTMALTKRVEVLFDPAEYQQLERLARSHGESVGALIRETVRRGCLGPDRERRQAAVKQLLAMQFDLGDWEEIKEELIETRVRDIEKSLEAP